MFSGGVVLFFEDNLVIKFGDYKVMELICLCNFVIFKAILKKEIKK